MKKLHILFSIILILSGAIYVNYNLPVFQQLSSHYFYVETEAKKIKTNSFSCITVNVVRSDTFLDRNKSILRGGSVSPVKYEYEVNGKKYTGQKKSYIETFFRCRHLVSKAYYFPLFPEWSVVENQIPDRAYMNNLFTSSAKFLGLSLLYVVFLIFRKRKIKLQT